METLLVELTPRGSYTSELTSDTLFGAVCWALADLGLADVGKLMREFETAPQFAFSSVFPFLHRGDARVRFFPMPLIPPLRAEQVERLSSTLPEAKRNLKRARREAIRRAKQLAKVALVSETLFGEIVRGETDAESLWTRTAGGASANDIERAGETILLTRAEREQISPDRHLPSFLAATDVQRNQIDRIAGATAEGLLFFEHQTFLRRESAGLWCLARTNDRKTIEAALRYLADTGIGGRRTTGRNQFDIRVRDGITIPEAGDNANALVLLSRYLPAPGEWSQRAPLAYRLRYVRGKHETKFPTPLKDDSPPIYKRLVRMVGEGSILPLGSHRDLYGRITRVGEMGERTVWHSGLALAARARIPEA